MRIEKRKIQWRAAAFFLGLAMCSGCGLTPRERTVLLPDLSTENYGDLEQMLTLSWNTDVPVFSTGFRQENGKAYLYTAVTENQEIYIRQYDVVYGFYQDIFRLPTSNCFGIWISPDGTEAACLSDDSGYNLSLSIYNLSDGSCTVLAEYLYDVQVDGVWSADASSFLGWSAEMPDGRHQAQCWYYKRQGNITTPLTIDLVRGDSFLLHGALSWNGGLGLIEGLSYDAIENGDESDLYLGYLHEIDASELLYFVPPEDEDNAYRPASFGENTQLYLQALLWQGHLPDISLLAVNEERNRAVTAENFGSGYMVYSYTLSGNGTFDGRKLLYRGEGQIQDLRFSCDGEHVLIFESEPDSEDLAESFGLDPDNAATDTPDMEFSVPVQTENWQAVILELPAEDS